MNALNGHYHPLLTKVIDRYNFKPDGDSYMFFAQICFLVETQRSDRSQSETRVAMIQGDSDGGSFEFAAEYPSMQQCKSKINRG